MPLNKPVLKDNLLTLFNQAWQNTTDPEQARQAFAEGLANYIDAFVRSGQVNVTVTVITTGTATAHSGGGSGTGNIT